MTEHQTIEFLDADMDRTVETYRMAPADSSMSKSRETEFAHPVLLGHQEGVVGEVRGVAASCHSRKKDTEAVSLGRMKILMTHEMMILKTHKMKIETVLFSIR